MSSWTMKLWASHCHQRSLTSRSKQYFLPFILCLTPLWSTELNYGDRSGMDPHHFTAGGGVFSVGPPWIGQDAACLSTSPAQLVSHISSWSCCEAFTSAQHTQILVHNYSPRPGLGDVDSNLCAAQQWFNYLTMCLGLPPLHGGIMILTGFSEGLVVIQRFFFAFYWRNWGDCVHWGM